MAEEFATGTGKFVWVKDRAGNEFLCPLSALRDPKSASPEELAECVDDATTERYAGLRGEKGRG